MIASITRWCLLLSVLLLNRPALAQTDAEYRENLEQASFQLIKTTVEFLTTDRQTFPNVQTTQCSCDSYDSLKAFIKQNDLVGADKLVDESKRRAAQHIAQINQPRTALNEVKDFLIQKIASGNRAERKNLPTYAAFEAALDDIINRTVSPETATAVSQQPATVSESAGLPDTLETPSPPITSTPTTQSNWISMAGIALFLSILSLIGVAFLIYTALKNQKPDQSARDIQFDSQLAKLADRVTKLEVRKNQPNESFQVNSQLEALERAVRQLEQNRAEKPATPAPAPKVPLEVVPPAPGSPEESEAAGRPMNRYRTPSVEPPKPSVFYARTADLGDGFSAGGLLTKPERDTVFDVVLENDTLATYQISENPDAQRLALSDPYSYLNDACEYLTQPNPTSRIRTEQAGRLSLQGDKWKIIEKAKIRFIS
ncbi:hypothetical protein [Larkinella arboricola]